MTTRKWPWILGGTLFVATLGCGGASGAEPSSAPASAPGERSPSQMSQKSPGLGDPARDGKFEFTVSGVKCGATKVGSGPLSQRAQGEFCVVDIQVKNIGKEAQLLVDSEQKAYDEKDVEYSVDSTAAIYLNEDSQVFFEEINPGNTVKGKLVYDVPKGTELTALELHDSMFSGGVRVELR